MGCSPHTKDTSLSLRQIRASCADEIKDIKCLLTTKCKQNQFQDFGGEGAGGFDAAGVFFA
jgi:hypothetical protein